MPLLALNCEWWLVKVRPSCCVVNPVSGCKPWRRLDEYSAMRLNGEWWKFGHLSAEWTPSAAVNPDGGWMNTAPCDWMDNGENSVILLLLTYYANSSSRLSVFNSPFTIDHSHRSSSTLSVISFQLSIYHSLLLNSLPSPPQPAGLRNCNAAAFASFWKFAAPFSKFRRRRNRTKRGGLCSYWFKFEYRLEIILMPLLALNCEWWMVKVRPSCCVVNPVSGCKPWRRLDEYSAMRLNGQWWNFGHLAASNAVVGLLTNNRSLQYTYPLPILYYFNASHVGQKINMGLNGEWAMVNGEWWNFGHLAAS